MAEHLPADDPLASYAERLTGDALGNQSLRGYLNGSIDAVLRIPDGMFPAAIATWWSTTSRTGWATATVP